MTAAPSLVTIIFNPNSTGDGEKNARTLARQLKKQGQKVALVGTQHAGHAREIASEFATKHADGMIISSSGDGGYHEVVNGVVTSSNPQVITGVLPSGNANDHYHFVHRGDTVQRIRTGDVDNIDLIKVTTPDWTAYAHSYVGVGMTSQIGKELTKATLNPLIEAWLVVSQLFKLRSVKIRVKGKVRSYDHMVWSNSGRMSKYLTLSTDASIDDGLFEVTRVKSGSIAGLLSHLFKATADSLSDTPQVEHFEFTALTALSMQLDGEAYAVPSGATVTLESAKQKLRCIV
ncbi:MAG: diacylglycerol kinase family protein [Candidatus Saccharimonas sp.]